MKTIHWKSDIFATVDPAGDWTGDTGPSTDSGAIAPNTSDAFATAASELSLVWTKGPK